MDVIYSIYNAQALVPSLIPHILGRGLRGYWPAWISQKEQGPWATETWPLGWRSLRELCRVPRSRCLTVRGPCLKSLAEEGTGQGKE